MKNLGKSFKQFLGVIFLCIAFISLIIALYGIIYGEEIKKVLIAVVLLLSLIIVSCTVVGLFLLGILKTNKQRKKERAEIMYDISKSSMIVVSNNDFTSKYDDIPKLLTKIDDIKVLKKTEFNKIPSIINIINTTYDMVEIEYNNHKYKIMFKMELYNPNEFSFLIDDKYFVSEEEKDNYLKANLGLRIAFRYDSNNIEEGFLLQLKIAETIVPDLCGIFDDNASRIIGPAWIKNITSSKNLPLLASIYDIQYIKDKTNYWLKTNGLNRCKIPELEIIGENEELLNLSVKMISATAEQTFYDSLGRKQYNIGVFKDETPIVIQLLDYKKGIKKYPKNYLGQKNDRIKNHRSISNLIFIYLNENDYKKMKYYSVDKYSNVKDRDYIMYSSKSELEKIENLAKERINFIKKYYKNNKAYIKIKDEDKNIWVELLSTSKDLFKGKLDIDSKELEKEINFTYEQILDWELIINDEYLVDPTTAYIIKYKK